MDSMKNILRNMEGFKKHVGQLDKMIEETILHPYVQKLLKEQEDITQEDVRRSFAVVDEWVRERENCSGCQGLHECGNMMRGKRPTIEKQYNSLANVFTECPYEVKRKIIREQRKLIRSHYINPDILEAEFSNADMDDEWRQEALKEAIEFSNEFEVGQPAKGLFFYGRFGTGKTFLMGCIANKLAERGIESTMVYVPDFIVELKQSISNKDNSLMEKIEHIKKTPVLFLDDLGSETVSPWVRDEVLSVVLQHRAGHKMPTMITSNLGYEELESHFAYTAREGENHMKAKRIMERIIYYTKPIYIDGLNRREKY